MNGVNELEVDFLYWLPAVTPIVTIAKVLNTPDPLRPGETLNFTIHPITGCDAVR